MGSSILDALHEESTTYTERYDLLPSATSATPTAVSIEARILGSTQSGLVVGTKLGTVKLATLSCRAERTSSAFEHTKHHRLMP